MDALARFCNAPSLTALKSLIVSDPEAYKEEILLDAVDSTKNPNRGPFPLPEHRFSFATACKNAIDVGYSALLKRLLEMLKAGNAQPPRFWKHVNTPNLVDLGLLAVEQSRLNPQIALTILDFGPKTTDLWAEFLHAFLEALFSNHVHARDRGNILSSFGVLARRSNKNDLARCLATACGCSNPTPVLRAICSGQTPHFHQSLANQSAYTLARILTLVPEATKQRDQIGRLPLHWICTAPERRRNVQLLYKRHREAIRIPDCYGDLPLHIACRNGIDIQTLLYLVRCYKQALSIPNKKGQLPLDLLLKCGKCDLVYHLDRKIVGIERYRIARMSPETFESFFALVKSSSSIQATRTFPWLVLLTQSIQWELDCKANDYRHWLPHDWVQILKQALAKTSPMPRHCAQTPDEKGRHALSYASEQLMPIEFLEFLESLNPNAIHTPCANGLLPLHYACQTQQGHEVVRHLMGVSPQAAIPQPHP